MDPGFYAEQDIVSRLSISTLVYYRFRPVDENALREVAENGIGTIELIESPEQFDLANTDSMQIMRRIAENSGVTIGAYHAHDVLFLDIQTEEKRGRFVSMCKRQVDTMLEAGCTIWGSHAGLPDRAVRLSLDDLLRHVEGTPARIAIENFTRTGTWVQDRIGLLDEYDHPQLVMILDIGHVRDTDGRNPMCIEGGASTVISMCSHRLAHVHLHGFKNGVDHHPPLCEGDEIRWLKIFRGLRNIGYDGFFNFEPKGMPLHADSVARTRSFPSAILEMAGASR